MTQCVRTHNLTLTTATQSEIAEAQLWVEHNRRQRKVNKEQSLAAKKCLHCMKMFQPSREWQVYCTGKCRTESYRDKLIQDVEALTQEVTELRAKNLLLEQEVLELITR